MYSYTFDEETGGILLNSSPTLFSKEPRPVYAYEMDLLGFNQYWNYTNQNETPYLWVESNSYYYRGKLIAKIKGGDLYTAPNLIPQTDEQGEVIYNKEKYELLPVDILAMCKKNEDFLNILENSSVKIIVQAYEKFKGKLDIFHVAFSGGKDSAVLLDLVEKALPKGSFIVIFGDTGMEFPDTYKLVKQTQKHCEEYGIPFYIARSHLTSEESWKLFGPPARALRWCCSVHKSTPQTLKMREITGKNDYTGMDFVGVRKYESLARSKYEVENYGKKQKGQYSYNPILEWTSAEIWLYIYANHIEINEAYKKGNSRAGCLFCPMSGGQSNYFRRQSYPDEIDKYVKIITDSNIWDIHDREAQKTYVTAGGWESRSSGRGLSNNQLKYKEKCEAGNVIMDIIHPNVDWREWMKTLGDEKWEYSVIKINEGWRFIVSEKEFKRDPSTGKIFRQALKKSAYCIGCGVCEANCKQGKLKFDGNRKLIITDCIHCHECYDIPMGCHVYNSLKMPQGERKMKTINCFDDHAPKKEWLADFFDLLNLFFDEHTLGPNMFTHFKRFLRDAKLIEENKCTNFSELIKKIGWENSVGLGLMLVNLVYNNAQFEWYVKQMNIDEYYTMQKLKDTLLLLNLKEKAANSVVNSYRRITSTPFGNVLNFGYVEGDEMVRTKCRISDNRVILYALYAFVEKCNMDREFHISVLYDEETERDGVSPVRIFGLYDENELQSILLGLTARYPQFINATFTNDLKTINLYDNKTSQDVLDLFKEDL